MPVKTIGARTAREYAEHVRDYTDSFAKHRNYVTLDRRPDCLCLSVTLGPKITEGDRPFPVDHGPIFIRKRRGAWRKPRHDEGFLFLNGGTIWTKPLPLRVWRRLPECHITRQIRRRKVSSRAKQNASLDSSDMIGGVLLRATRLDYKFDDHSYKTKGVMRK